MRAAGLPEAFVETIETGWWTTCLEVVPAPERARGRFHVYRDALPPAFASARRLGGRARRTTAALPVVPLFGSAVFPPRLWVYTNFDCNLACSYCAVASSPRARKRRIGLERFRALVDEAVAEGFAELYVTGGEPFVERDIVAMLRVRGRAPADRLPDQRDALHRAAARGARVARAGCRRSSLQSSVDGARRGDARPLRAATGRGRGRWTGSRTRATLGLPVRVAMTETPANARRGRRPRARCSSELDVAARRPAARRSAGSARRARRSATR